MASPDAGARAAYRSTTRLTMAGRVALPVSAASLVGSWAFGGLIGLFASTSVAVLVCAWWLTRRQLSGLTLGPPPPARVHVGDAFHPEVTLQHDGRGPGTWHLRLTCGEASGTAERPAGSRFRLVPGERLRLPLEHRLLRRGRHPQLEVSVGSTFPFGLVEHRLHFRLPVDFLALPRLGSLNDLGRLPQGARDPQPQPRPFERGEEEFYGVRAWREGESVRRVHWRLSARRGRRVLREYRLNAEPPVHLVLATCVPQDTPLDAPRKRFERSVSLTATLAEHFLRRGRSLRLTLSGSEPVTHPLVRGRGGLLRLLSTLAEVGFVHGDSAQAADQGLGSVPRGEVPIAVFVGSRPSAPKPEGGPLRIDVLDPGLQRLFLPGAALGHGGSAGGGRAAGEWILPWAHRTRRSVVERRPLRRRFPEFRGRGLHRRRAGGRRGLAVHRPGGGATWPWSSCGPTRVRPPARWPWARRWW